MRIRVLEAIFLVFSKPRRELSWTLKSLLNFQVIYRQAENNLQTSKSHDIVCGFVFPTPEKKNTVNDNIENCTVGEIWREISAIIA